MFYHTKQGPLVRYFYLAYEDTKSLGSGSVESDLFLVFISIILGNAVAGVEGGGKAGAQGECQHSINTR